MYVCAYIYIYIFFCACHVIVYRFRGEAFHRRNPRPAPQEQDAGLDAVKHSPSKAYSGPPQGVGARLGGSWAAIRHRAKYSTLCLVWSVFGVVGYVAGGISGVVGRGTMVTIMIRVVVALLVTCPESRGFGGAGCKRSDSQKFTCESLGCRA